jgi:hypothetical protein
MCTGFILSNAYETLKELGYKVIPVKITGATQDIAEEEFIKHLERFGVQIEEAKKVRSYNGFLTWLKENLEDRERFVKTGWKRWKHIREALL